MENTLVKIHPSSNEDYLAVETASRKFGTRQGLWLSRDALSLIVDGRCKSNKLRDGETFVELYAEGNNVEMTIWWLSVNAYDSSVRGVRQELSIPKAVLKDAVEGISIRYLMQGVEPCAKLDFTNAQKTIKEMYERALLYFLLALATPCLRE